ALQPRRTGDPARHRAPGLRRARLPAQSLEGRQAQARAARRRRQGPARASPRRDPQGEGGVMAGPRPDGGGLDEAYAACRAVARSRAKNFYYAFVALPEERRNAICATYAFMRRADDLADDDSLPREERRRRLDDWLAAWRDVCRGAATTDPVFLALSDTTRRFAIPLGLLDELVAGMTMDLRPSACDAPDTYATFSDLYGYCYRVASVVGLVCIRIFGYEDRGAEKLAEETGIAFQLTNILRDVAEDAGFNRVYLPLEDLKAHGVTLESLLHRAPGAPPTANERALLAEVARRAEAYYRSAQRLLPL